MKSWVCCDPIVCVSECEPEFQIKIYEPNISSAFVEFSIPLLATFTYFHLGNAENWERISWLENYSIAMVT